jgi:LacI family transcriptional regulator
LQQYLAIILINKVKRKKSNIRDIAAATNLSVTTVSRVLNGKAKQFRISEKSTNLIIETAEALNYIPNQIAQYLQSGKTKTIALIIPSLINPFFSRIAGNINAELQQLGYTTLIGDSNESCEIEREEIIQIISSNVEGILIVPCGDSKDNLELIKERNIQVVCIDRYTEGLDIPFVSTDNYQGAYKATQHFINNGHTNIACIQGIQSSMSNKLRIKGFKEAIKEAGIHDFQITGNAFSVQNGYAETLLLLHSNERPTAIFALSNTISLGCIKALKENNVRVPEDISVITFDDHPYMDFLSTPLTCVAQPIDAICKIAIRLLFDQISNQTKDSNQIFLPPTIKYRDSVKQLDLSENSNGKHDHRIQSN